MSEWYKTPGLWIVRYAGLRCWAIVTKRRINVYGANGRHQFRTSTATPPTVLEPIKEMDLYELRIPEWLA